MFFWMKLKGISDTKKLIQEKALAKEVRKSVHVKVLKKGCQ